MGSCGTPLHCSWMLYMRPACTSKFEMQRGCPHAPQDSVTPCPSVYLVSLVIKKINLKNFFLSCTTKARVRIRTAVGLELSSLSPQNRIHGYRSRRFFCRTRKWATAAIRTARTWTARRSWCARADGKRGQCRLCGDRCDAPHGPCAATRGYELNIGL